MSTCLVWNDIFKKWTKYEDNWSTRTTDITGYVIACRNRSSARVSGLLSPKLSRTHRRHLLNFWRIFRKLVLKWSEAQGLLMSRTEEIGEHWFYSPPLIIGDAKYWPRKSRRIFWRNSPCAHKFAYVNWPWLVWVSERGSETVCSALLR